MKLTNCQQQALNVVDDLVASPDQHYLVISGSAGTGKSSLVRKIIERYINVYQPMSIMLHEEFNLVLTATTNKAANNLHSITGYETSTTQKFLGMYKKGRFITYPKKIVNNTLFIVDEFSYADEKLVKALKAAKGSNTKIVFIGDECQLPPVDSPDVIPVISKNYPTVRLTQQVRQDTSVLKALGEELKNFVITGDMDEFVGDGKSIIQYADSDKFTDALIKSFSEGTSRFISYTNARGVEVNEFLHEELTGSSGISEGDSLVMNSFFAKGKLKIPTDTEGRVTNVKEMDLRYPLRDGSQVTVSGHIVRFQGITVFVPTDFNDYVFYVRNKEVLGPKQLEAIESFWADLRHLYASTVHKAQGSTYDQIFIDLTDFKGVRDQNMLARLLYVALTRAKKKVHIFGEI